jgi:hypothetical protein
MASTAAASAAFFVAAPDQARGTDGCRFGDSHHLKHENPVENLGSIRLFSGSGGRTAPLGANCAVVGMIGLGRP